MNRRFVYVAVGLVAAFAAAQLVRPSSSNPPTNPARTIGAHAGKDLSVIVERSCRDCHSNGTVWPRYAKVAPLSWLMSYAVTKGRSAVNFSEWSTYPPDVQRTMLAASCQDASAGKMPGIYAWLRPETRLSASDVETICLAARQ
jgi:heme-binding protein